MSMRTGGGGLVRWDGGARRPNFPADGAGRRRRCGRAAVRHVGFGRQRRRTAPEPVSVNQATGDVYVATPATTGWCAPTATGARRRDRQPADGVPLDNPPGTWPSTRSPTPSGGRHRQRPGRPPLVDDLFLRSIGTTGRASTDSGRRGSIDVGGDGTSTGRHREQQGQGTNGDHRAHLRSYGSRAPAGQPNGSATSPGDSTTAPACSSPTPATTASRWDVIKHTYVGTFGSGSGQPTLRGPCRFSEGGDTAATESIRGRHRQRPHLGVALRRGQPTPPLGEPSTAGARHELEAPARQETTPTCGASWPTPPTTGCRSYAVRPPGIFGRRRTPFGAGVNAVTVLAQDARPSTWSSPARPTGTATTSSRYRLVTTCSPSTPTAATRLSTTLDVTSFDQATEAVPVQANTVTRSTRPCPSTDNVPNPNTGTITGTVPSRRVRRALGPAVDANTGAW